MTKMMAMVKGHLHYLYRQQKRHIGDERLEAIGAAARVDLRSYYGISFDLEAHSFDFCYQQHI